MEKLQEEKYVRGYKVSTSSLEQEKRLYTCNLERNSIAQRYQFVEQWKIKRKLGFIEHWEEYGYEEKGRNLMKEHKNEDSA